MQNRTSGPYLAANNRILIFTYVGIRHTTCSWSRSVLGPETLCYSAWDKRLCLSISPIPWEARVHCAKLGLACLPRQKPTFECASVECPSTAVTDSASHLGSVLPKQVTSPVTGSGR
jgi:hypothetical protein